MRTVGYNGVSACCVAQAIYHGKPIVGMPFQGDQPSNADRVVAKASVKHLLSCQAAATCIYIGAIGAPALQLLLFRRLLRNPFARQSSACHGPLTTWVFRKSEGVGWLVTRRYACAGFQAAVSLLQAGKPELMGALTAVPTML
jgi:hypothetical protein